MPDSVFYYGGSDLYEGEPVSGEAELRENRFFIGGYEIRRDMLLEEIRKQVNEQ